MVSIFNHFIPILYKMIIANEIIIRIKYKVLIIKIELAKYKLFRKIFNILKLCQIILN